MQAEGPGPSAGELSNRCHIAIVYELSAIYQLPNCLSSHKVNVMHACFLRLTKPFSCRFVGLVCLLAGASGLALACDTPVYRYALYRWEPAPYEIYYFHDKPLDEPATQIQNLVKAVSESEEKPANIFFVDASLTDDPELKRIPPDVRKTWKDQQNPPIPSYMVVTPYGRSLFQGALDEATLKALLDSPARTQVAKQLADGCAGVLIQVNGKDAAVNDAAEKVTKELIADVGAGKIELYLPPGMEDPAEGDGEQPKSGLPLGYLKVARDDPAEKWLIDSLLSMEEDLTSEEYVGQPMIFAVFGRGRALPPFVGKGITRDNLLECVYFLTGACSCTVKDQNPGMDLLFAENWWTMAEKLAAQVGAEEGNETQLGAAQLFPHLMIPGGQAAAAGAEPTGSGESPKTESPKPDSPQETTPPTEAPPAEAPAADSGAAKPAAEGMQPEAAAGQAPKEGLEPTQVETEKAAAQAGPPAEDAQSSAPRGEQPEGEKKPEGEMEGQPEPADQKQVEQAAPAAAEPAGHADSVLGAAHPESHAADAIGIVAVAAGLCLALVLLCGVTFLTMRAK